MPKFFSILLFVLVLLQLADLGTTVYGLSLPNSGISEANPLMQYLMSYGMSVFIIIKLCVIVLSVIIYLSIFNNALSILQNSSMTIYSLIGVINIYVIVLAMISFYSVIVSRNVYILLLVLL